MFGDDWLVPLTSALAGLLLGGMCLVWRPDLAAIERSGVAREGRAMSRRSIDRTAARRRLAALRRGAAPAVEEATNANGSSDRA